MSYDMTADYRARAAAAPWDHRIPWNCPTFYDGCNCRETVRAMDPKVRSVLQEEAYELRHARAVLVAWDELEADLARAIELLDALAGREFLDDYVGPNRDAHEWLVEYGVRDADPETPSPVSVPVVLDVTKVEQGRPSRVVEGEDY